MKNLCYKEDLLLVFTSNELRLNKYDNKFFTNLVMLISKNKFITTNQIELFDKLVIKYARQLRKIGYTQNVIENLQWSTNIIQSDKEHTEAFIDIHNGEVIVRVPFSRKFIDEWNDGQAVNGINVYKWNKEHKYYIAKLSTVALKLAYALIPKFFKLNCSVEVQKIFDGIKVYENCIWNPTLVRSNKYYYISGTNQYLDTALSQLEFNKDPKTLSTLAKHGVKISDSITGDDKFLDFCSKYYIELNVDKVKDFKEYCLQLGVGTIIINQRFERHTNTYNKLLQMLSGLIVLPEYSEVLDTMKPKPIIYIHYGIILRNISFIRISNEWKKMLEKQVYFGYPTE